MVNYIIASYNTRQFIRLMQLHGRERDGLAGTGEVAPLVLERGCSGGVGGEGREGKMV